MDKSLETPKLPGMTQEKINLNIAIKSEETELVKKKKNTEKKPRSRILLMNYQYLNTI